LLSSIFLFLALVSPLAAQKSPRRTAGRPPLTELDAVIEKAIAADEIPGAVLVVGHQGRILHRKAYGWRALLPQREPMTLDTIFDIASLTKVVATTPAVVKLIEQGLLRLNDPVARYVPEFAAKGKDQVSVRHLLTHTSGLRPIPRITGAWSGTEPVLNAIYDDTLIAPPGARFIYSDTGFILLGEVVRRVSGLPLDEYVARNIFAPLGMRHTRFRPREDSKPRIAPTEEIDLPEGAKAGSGRGRVLRGEVHDPRARQMGGVAGHAGLFSTAGDLTIFCRMLLAEGRIPATQPAEASARRVSPRMMRLGRIGGPAGPSRARRLFSAATVHKMVTPQSPPWSPTLRGLGWDIDSVYSALRGELFPVASFVHTGFTGTSVWIDPASRTFIILLANSVHPHERPAISSLRSRVATVVAAALNLGESLAFTSLLERSAGAERLYGPSGQLVRQAQTRTGIDVLEEEDFGPLRGKRVGLITNQTCVDRNGRSTIDLLWRAEGVKLVALFNPEHGITGREEGKIPSSTDPATGLPIHSLYSDTRRPTEEMLRGIDAIVFDLQDAGVRFYTYLTTMAYAMEEAAKRKISFYVLDRPNPLGGEALEGPMLDPDRRSFIGYFVVPVRYGMTIGELARLFNTENKINADLHVIPMKQWERRDPYEATGLLWIPPSPNLRSLYTALLYPGIEILEDGGVSVGRGTDTPFALFGAPWIRATELAGYLNQRFVPGVRFVPTRFTPRSSLYKDVPCEGISLVITDRASLHSMLMGLEIASAVAKLYPNRFTLEKTIRLLGSAATLERLKKGDAPTRIVEDWADDLEAFRKIRAKYLLYP
jgi:uncharacterized protein YbbC (DUF1343 family)/CubicO group peptidase (beta-lactamase class C family)